MLTLRRSVRSKLPIIAAFLVALAAPAIAQAQTFTIDFESDAPGAVPNGFMSVDSAVVSFTDSSGADLQVIDATPQTNGQGLTVFPDDPSYLIIDFLVPMQAITLSFGNDDPAFSSPGDEAELRIFNGVTLVTSVRVVMNRNDIMDQTIGFSGAPFDRAEFFYDVSSAGLIEAVDDIVLTPAAPAPTLPQWAALMMLLLLVAAGFLAMRRAASRPPAP